MERNGSILQMRLRAPLNATRARPRSTAIDRLFRHSHSNPNSIPALDVSSATLERRVSGDPAGMRFTWSWSTDFWTDFSSLKLSVLFGIQLCRVGDIRVAGSRSGRRARAIRQASPPAPGHPPFCFCSPLSARRIAGGARDVIGPPHVRYHLARAGNPSSEI